MVKKILKYLIYGISWGCVFFVLTYLIGYLCVGKDFVRPLADDFATQAFGGILAGILCGSTSIVYTVERLPFWAQILIHAGVGLTGYFILAYKLGWMPSGTILHMVSFIVFGFVVFALIWSGFYLYNRHEAKKVNKKLKELEESKKTK